MCWWPASCHLGLILAMCLSHSSVSWEAGSALVTHGTDRIHPVTMPTSHHNSGPCRTLEGLLDRTLYLSALVVLETSHFVQTHPEIPQQALAVC